jgi:hypothetical protein
MHESENKDLSFCNYWTNSASKRKGKNYKARAQLVPMGMPMIYLLNMCPHMYEFICDLVDLHEKMLKIPKCGNQKP